MSTYPTYKNSGIEWLADVPEHWEVNRLKNITAKSIGGVWGDEPNEDGKDTIVVRVADFDRDKASIIDSEEFTYRAISENHLLDRKLNKNDILLEKSGGGEKQLVGKAVIFDKDFDAVCANFIQKVEIIERFDKRFILHVFTSIYDGRINFPYVNQTTGIQNLDITAFFNHCISYPKSKEKQTAIANYLDEKTSKLDQLISNKKAQIEKLKEIRKIEIFTAVTKGLDPNVKLKPSCIEWLGDIPEHWEVKRIKDHVRVNISSLGSDTDSEMIIKYLDISNVNNTGLTGDIQELQFFEAPSRARRIVQNGDVVMSTVRPYLKAITYLDDISDNMIASTGFAVMTAKSNYNSKFLFYQTVADWFNEKINSKSVGASYPALNSDVLVATNILLPPLTEQTAIANYLDEKTSKLDQLVSNLENQIEQLQEVRKIEIYNAVTGKIKIA